MALQAAAFLPSALAAHKEGKVSDLLKDCGLFGVSLADHAKADFSTVALRTTKKTGDVVKAQTVVAAPSATWSTHDGKKTLRKGSVIVTRASSGLGLAPAKSLAETGKWHVVMACRDFLETERAAKAAGMAKESCTIMLLDLASLDSVRQFVDNFRQFGRPLDVLVCNAVVYFPTANEPTFTAKGFELSGGTNHLGHYLLSGLLLDDTKKSDYPSKRLIIVRLNHWEHEYISKECTTEVEPGRSEGVTRRTKWSKQLSAMIDGGDFDGARAYKDSKVCNMLTMQEFRRRFNEDTVITYASLYPGCIATTSLFRALFPIFQRHITIVYVSEDEDGKRLAQVVIVSDPSLTKAGVYRSWNKASASFENQLSEEACDADKARWTGINGKTQSAGSFLCASVCY